MSHYAIYRDAASIMLNPTMCNPNQQLSGMFLQPALYHEKGVMLLSSSQVFGLSNGGVEESEVDCK